MAVTAPTPPQAPVVPKVEMAPTHGGGQTETIGTGNTGSTGTDSGSTGENTSATSGQNGRETNSFGTKTNETQLGKTSDGEKTDDPQKNQEQQTGKATDTAETKDVSEALQLPVASTETETQTQQGFQYPPEDNHSVLGTYWPFLLVFAVALIYFMYRNYQKSHTIEVKKPVTLRELLEQEEAQERGHGVAEKTEPASPPEKPEVKKNDGHIEIRI